jgi:hypothetical protein
MIWPADCATQILLWRSSNVFIPTNPDFIHGYDIQKKSRSSDYVP